MQSVRVVQYRCVGLFNFNAFHQHAPFNPSTDWLSCEHCMQLCSTSAAVPSFKCLQVLALPWHAVTCPTGVRRAVSEEPVGCHSSNLRMACHTHWVHGHKHCHDTANHTMVYYDRQHVALRTQDGAETVPHGLLLPQWSGNMGPWWCQFGCAGVRVRQQVVRCCTTVLQLV